MISSIEQAWRLGGMPDLATAVEVTVPDDHVACFRDRGFSAVRMVLDVDVVHEAAREAQQLHASVWSDSPTVTMSERSARRHPAWRFDEATPALRALLTDPALAAIVGTVFAGPARIAAFEVFVRRPGMVGTSWHFDRPYLPFSGRTLVAWLPLLSHPAGHGLNYAADFGFGPVAARFVDLRPGDVTYHGDQVPHCGQTYDTLSAALGILMYEDGSTIEPGEGPASELGRDEFRRRIFPNLQWGAPAVTAWTPLLAEGPGKS